MKINSIKISNVMNFKEYANFDECPETKFNAGVNLIIGPNGSGKSNLLEIINSVFNKGVSPSFSLQEGPIKSHKMGNAADTSKCISANKSNLVLPVNNNSTTSKQIIQIQIGLTKQDKNNLKFLKNNKSELNSLISKYSQLRPTILDVEDDVIDNIKTLDLKFETSQESEHLILTSEYSSNLDKFVLSYLYFFIFFQYVIFIANRFEEKTWEYLANPFSSISSYRNYTNIENQFKVSENESDVIQGLRATMAVQPITGVSEKEPIVFNYIRTVFGFRFHSLVMRHGLNSYPDSSKFEDPFFVELNKKLKEILQLELFIKIFGENSQNYWFHIRHTDNQQIASINQLSAGEKGLLHFIFAIFGYQLQNGVMIIDEPEIHLHPQMQDKCLELLRIMAKDYSMQFIVVTHSPILVNYEIIEGVQRFYKESNETKIISPEFNIQIQDLVRYLNYTRATKVLFSTHAVLTEGDSDAYFYKFFYDELKKNDPKLVDLEFVDIGGVNYDKPWKKFFDSWEIKWFFIRDKDQLQLTDEQIESRYSKNEFILKLGNLESYVGHEFKKKLANVVKFCTIDPETNTSDFKKWLKDDTNKLKIDELKTIFTKISQTVKSL